MDIYRLLSLGWNRDVFRFIASDLGQILNAVKGLGVKEIKVKEMGIGMRSFGTNKHAGGRSESNHTQINSG